MIINTTLFRDTVKKNCKLGNSIHYHKTPRSQLISTPSFISRIYKLLNGMEFTYSYVVLI